jgi:predicted nucleotidyltransferase
MIHIAEKERAEVRKILQQTAPDCEARVFGSRLKGNHWQYSDLDIALATNKRSPLGYKRLGDIRYAFEESTLPFHVDVLDWEAMPVEFRESIGTQYEVIL